VSQKIRAVVTGAAGKMAGRMIALIREAPDFVLVGATERPGHPAHGRDAGEVAGAGHAGVKVADDIAPLLTGADVAIDFTAPEASVAHVRAAAADADFQQLKKAVVSLFARAGILAEGAPARESPP